MNFTCLKTWTLFVLTSLGLIFGIGNSAKAYTYDWISNAVGDQNNWNNPVNWSGGALLGVPGANDDVRIGVIALNPLFPLTSALMPIIGSSTGLSGPGSSTPACKSITFGPNGPLSSYTYGTMSNLSLTILSGYTLTVSGTVTQNNFASVTGSANNYTTSTIAGAGKLICSGNLIVGDLATQPQNKVAAVSRLSVQIAQLTVSGNVVLNATGNSNNSTLQNSGLCYPYLSIENGTTTLAKPITFATNASSTLFPVLSAFNIRNPGSTWYQGYGLVTVDNSSTTAAKPCTLELLAQVPITKADNFYVYFTFGGNNGTVIYDYGGTGNQTIYTANEPSVTTTQSYINTTLPAGITTTSSANYYNLTLSGSSKKVIDNNSSITGSPTQGLTVGNSFNTNTGAVDFATNNASTTITGAWTNSITVTQGTKLFSTGSMVNSSSTVTLAGGGLTVGSSMQITAGTVTAGAGNVTVNGAFKNVGGTLTCGTGSTVFNGDYTNTSTFTANATGAVFFSGAAAQALSDNSTSGTKFNKVTFSNNGKKTMSGTGATYPFSVSGTGILTMAGTSTELAAGGVLTLISDPTGSASIDIIPTGTKITGNVNVQRYMSGGNVSYNKRGYRFLSSPVNNGTIGATTGYNLTALLNTTPITGWGLTGTYSATPTAGKFDPTPTGNPSVFFYYEPDRDPANRIIANSDYKAINSPTDLIPVGNGILFFFRGDRTVKPNKFSTTFVPENTTLNNTGVPNQGDIKVYIPTALGTSTLGSHPAYTQTAAAGSLSAIFSKSTTVTPNTDGFHLVGNPYPCTIDLEEALRSANFTAPAYTPGNNYVYGLNNQGAFGSYLLTGNTASTGTSTGNITRWIASGQGFFVKVATPTGTTPPPTLTFHEACKVTSGYTLPTSFSVAAVNNAPFQVLHINLMLDSTNANETVIQFGYNHASNKFSLYEDAPYLTGPSQTTYLTSYSSDDQPCLINQMAALDSVKSITLYVGGSYSGKYSLTFSGAQSLDPRYRIFLKDSFMNDSLDVSANITYKFDLDLSNPKTYGDKRFSLSVQPTNIENLYQLTNIDAIKNNNSVQVNWTATHEGTYIDFKIQRSTDGGKTFTTIGEIPSDGSGKYGFTDTNPLLSGTNLYRILQSIDDNEDKLSAIVTVSYITVKTEPAKLKLYPNPVSNTLNVSLNSAATNGRVSMKIYNMSSEMVMSQNFTDSSALTMDVSKLVQGAYVIHITDSNKDYGAVTFTKL